LRFPFSQACGADPAKVDVELVNLVTRSVNRGQPESVQLLILEIENFVTAQAHEVMMLMDLGIKAGRSAQMANPIDEPYADQRLQHTIHGGARHAGQSTPDGVVHLLGCRMILAREDSLEDGPPLYREREALPAAKVLKLLNPFSLQFRMHLYTFR
jgi:hypothetical protein